MPQHRSTGTAHHFGVLRSAPSTVGDGLVAGSPDTKQAAAGAAYLLAALISCLLLQKIALPGTGGQLSITTLLVPVVCLVGLVRGQLKLFPPSLVALLAICSIAGLSSMFSASTEVSVTSLLLLVGCQLPWMVRPSAPISYERGWQIYQSIAVLICVAGVFQFLIQFAIGNAAFSIDRLPKGIIVYGYNLIIPLNYGATIIKSNGVVLVEPSVFSQVIAVALIFELSCRRRVWAMALFSLGLIVSFSGTGLVVAMVFGGWLVLALAPKAPVSIVVLVVLLIAVFALGGFEYAVNRAPELVVENSSGNARFLSMFAVLDRDIFTSTWSTLFGRGAGTVLDGAKSVSFDIFDATWAKLIYEYGLLTGGIYVAMVFAFALRSSAVTSYALLLVYFVMGGYLLNPAMTGIVAVMMAWLSPKPNDIQIRGNL